MKFKLCSIMKWLYFFCLKQLNFRWCHYFYWHDISNPDVNKQALSHKWLYIMLIFHFYLSWLFLYYFYRLQTLILLAAKLAVCGVMHFYWENYLLFQTRSGQNDLNKYFEKYFPQFHTMLEMKYGQWYNSPVELYLKNVQPRKNLYKDYIKTCDIYG